MSAAGCSGWTLTVDYFVVPPADHVFELPSICTEDAKTNDSLINMFDSGQLYLQVGDVSWCVVNMVRLRAVYVATAENIASRCLWSAAVNCFM